MKKLLYCFAIYLSCHAQASALDFDPCEQLYYIEVFDQNKIISPGSKKKEEGHVLIVSSKATWQQLKEAMKEAYNDQFKVKDYFLFPAYGTFTVKTKTREVKPSESNKTFFYLLENKKPMWQYPHFYDTHGFEDLKKERYYRLAEKMSSQVRRLEKSQKEGKSIFIQGKDKNFQLMSIDDYHALRSEDPSTWDKPKSRCTLLDELNLAELPSKDIVVIEQDHDNNATKNVGLIVLIGAPLCVLGSKHLKFPFKKSSKHHDEDDEGDQQSTDPGDV